MLFFKRKKKINNELEDSFKKVLSEIDNIDEKGNPRKIEHYILDSCEHIISTAKEVESAKLRFNMLNEHLADVKKIENMQEDVRGVIKELSDNVQNLIKKKQVFKETEKRLPDESFMLLQEREDMVVSDIQRMDENEKYKDKISNEIRELEGEKSRQEIEREDIFEIIKRLRIVTIVVFVLVIGLICAWLTLPDDIIEKVRFVGVLILFVLVLSTFLISIYVSRKRTEYRSLTKKLNQNISLLNVARMRYVNIDKALQYELQVYNVNTSAELLYFWEQYMLTVKEYEAYRKNNVDLAYYIEKLYDIFKSLGLTFERKWIEKVSLLYDLEELSKFKLNLAEKINIVKNQIDMSSDMIRSEREEIDRLMKEYNFFVPEVMEIITSVDKFCLNTLVELNK